MAALAIGLTLALGPKAAAGDPVAIHYGYGIGYGADLGGDLQQALDADGMFGGRFYLGARRGWLGVEASLAGTDTQLRTGSKAEVATGEESDVSTFALALEARAALPLQPWLHLYVRGGPARALVKPTGGPPVREQRGFAVVYAAGAELVGERALTSSSWIIGLSLWLEHTRQHLAVSDEQAAMEGTVDLTLLGIGFSIGRR